MFPKIVVPPNHPILIGFSIQFGVPLFLEKPKSPIWEGSMQLQMYGHFEGSPENNSAFWGVGNIVTPGHPP